MKYIQKQQQIVLTIAPTKETLILMDLCGCKDFNKFVEQCIQITSWLAGAKSDGMAVGAFTHDHSKILKLYNPMLETISAKSS